MIYSCLLELEEFLDVIYFLIEIIWATECCMRHYVALALSFLKLSFVRILVVVDLINCLWIEPCDSLSMFPKTILYLSFAWVFVNSKTVLFTIIPPAFVFSSISPEIKAISSLFVLFVLSFIGNSIGIDIYTHTVHVVIIPVSIVFSSIFPFVLADTINAIINPVTLVNGAICP